MAPELRGVHGTLLKAVKIGWQHKGPLTFQWAQRRDVKLWT
jgi:hypothetical protein